MKLTFNRLAISLVGLSIILFSLFKLGFPVLGILKIIPFVAFIAFGILIIIAALKDS